MSLTIGRIGTDVTLEDPDTCNLDGDTLTLAGSMSASTVSDLLVLRQQLLGLVDSDDDPVVPITWTEDATINGFYEVVSVSVPSIPVMLAAANTQWSATFNRIPGYAYPVISSVTQTFTRTNSVGVAGPNYGRWCFPAAATEWTADNLTSVGVLTRSSASGTMNVTNQFTATGPNMTYWSATTSNFYTGAAKIEVGSTLRTVVGRQLDASNGTPALWRLSNDLLRITPTTSGGVSTGGLSMQSYDGATWEPAATKQFTVNDRSGGSAIGPFTTMRILRNTPEVCVLRLTALAPGATGIYANIDLRLCRGSRHVELYFSQSQAAYQWQIRRSSAEASTAVTGGIRATANDGDGNRFFILSPSTCTTDLVNGRLGLTSSAANGQFAIGNEVGGSGAAAIDLETAVAVEYFQVLLERQSVISR